MVKTTTVTFRSVTGHKPAVRARDLREKWPGQRSIDPNHPEKSFPRWMVDRRSSEQIEAGREKGRK